MIAGLRRLLLGSTVAVAGVWAAGGADASSYVVRIEPAGAEGLHCKLTLDVTHAFEGTTNRLMLLGFTHDGVADSAECEGGPCYGDLLSAATPADTTTLEAQFFHNSLTVPFDALGTTLSTSLEISDEAGPSGSILDEVSMYLLRSSDNEPYPTSDGLGANALFAIDITGVAGGDLTVFAPMTFVPPDTLLLSGNVADVPIDRLAGRLRLQRLIPNPSSSSVRLDYEVPAPGGQLRIDVTDVSGRRVATVINENRAAGQYSTIWTGKVDGGNRANPGVYFLKLQMAGQAVVRRIVIAR